MDNMNTQNQKNTGIIMMDNTNTQNQKKTGIIMKYYAYTVFYMLEIIAFKKVIKGVFFYSISALIKKSLNI